jgi:hypothetical protein
MSKPWVQIPQDVQSLSSQTAAMEGYHYKNWIVEVLTAAVENDRRIPSLHSRLEDEELSTIPQELKDKADAFAASKGIPVADFVIGAIKSNCWDPVHLKAVQDAL